MGQKQTCAAQKVMSALPPIADMCSALGDVRFVPKADINGLFGDTADALILLRVRGEWGDSTAQ